MPRVLICSAGPARLGWLSVLPVWAGVRDSGLPTGLGKGRQLSPCRCPPHPSQPLYLASLPLPHLPSA